MKSLLYYLIQVTAASGILYGYYHLALRNKRFHRYNRFFLLGAVVISTLIPFLNIPVYFNADETAASPVLRTLAAISSGSGSSIEIIAPANERSTSVSWLRWDNALYLFYILIAILAFTRILFSLRKIRSIIKSNNVEKLDNIHFVNTNEPGTPFSFFRWLFWNKKIELNSAKGEQIFRHELFHIREKHSIDILFMEAVTVIFWINPFFHLMKREIKAIHEFLADRFAIKETSRWEYAEMLLMQALNTRTQLVNPFFHTQIKRRIAMITSSSKPGHQYLRKLLVLPIAAVVVGLFAFTYKDRKETVSKAARPITVLIDAGHGGIDPGVKSPDSKYTEAQLTLEIAKTIQRISGEYNITVKMTRNDDRLPGNATTIADGLKNRTAIANEIKPDAFVAIHLNSAGKNSFQSSHSGIEAYITNKKEDKQSRLLASILLQELVGTYTTSQTIQQREENGIYILDHSLYPSVLIECGYINNEKDLAFITDKSKQEATARSILKALADYTNTHQATGMNTSMPDTVKPGAKAQILVKGDLATRGKTDDPNTNTFFSQKMEFHDNDGSSIALKNVEFSTHGFNNNKDTSHPLFTDMLFIIDGKELPKLTAFKDLNNILNPDDISSINVWKNKTAIERFGEKGRNGVIEIVTKKGRSNNKLQVKNDIEVDNKIFERVEIIPSFPGGVTKGKEFLMTNINADEPLTKGAPNGVYTVIGQFIVNKDGSVSDVKALTHFGYGMEEQVINVLKKGPHWLPAIQNGKEVTAYHKIPVTFVVADAETKNTNNVSVSVANTMGVLFVGMDNPVTIKTSEADKDLIITISQGTITGKNGKYIVRVEKEGEAIITIQSKSGKTSASFPFKVKLQEAKKGTTLLK